MRGAFKKKWLLNIKETISTPPVVTKSIFSKSQIIFGTNSGKIFNISETGKVNWIYQIIDSNKEQKPSENKVLDKPLVLETEKKILFVSKNRTLNCLNFDGELEWTRQIKNEANHSPTKNNKKELLLGLDSGEILFINLSGEIRKILETNEKISSPLTTYEDKIIFGTKDGKIRMITEEGKSLWSFETKDSIKAKITLLDDYHNPMILVPSEDQCIYAISMDGELLWKFETQGPLTTEVELLTINHKKTILIGSHDNNIYCVSLQGELLWSYETDFRIETTPVINRTPSEKTTIILGSQDRNLYLLDSNGKFNLKNLPGLSGVVNQSTTQISSLSKELGSDNGKLLDKLPVESNIEGFELVKPNEIILLTKKGDVCYLEII